MLSHINILYSMCCHYYVEISNNTKCKDLDRVLITMEAQTYFDSLKSQGFDDEDALSHTNRFYPDFILNSATAMDTGHNEWISQNFQRIASECYPDDKGAVFTIAGIRENGQVIEVVAHSNPSIGYDPVRYDFVITNGVPTLDSTYSHNPDGSWSPLFSTGPSQPEPIAQTFSPTSYSPPVHQTHPPQTQQMGQYPPQTQQMGQYPPQQQQMGQYNAQQQPIMQGQPAYGQQGMMQQVQVGSRSKIVTFLLGFFLGVLGVHNFYLGKTGLGITQLLLTVLTFGIGTLITWPWSLIESILALASPNFRDGDGMPLSD